MKRRILLVDDDPSVLLTLKAVLEMNGFEVHTAASSGAAFDQLTKGPYDLVMTDSHMETENSGYQVVRAARSQPYKPATAILTAFPAAQSELESAADAVLLKPLGASELLHRVETLLQPFPKSE